MPNFNGVEGSRLSAMAHRRAESIVRLPARLDEPLDASAFTAVVVETLAPEAPQTISQRALDTSLTTWLYERVRDRMLRVAGMPDFATEVAAVAGKLRPEPGDVVLDLACGHGNFTVEWAKRVGPEGLVIGVDYSRSMLRRAAARVQASGVDNVVLIHGDAHRLPLASGSIQRVNCSGGFHAFPDLPRALDEIARVTTPGSTLTASTFAQHPSDRLVRTKNRMNDWFSLHFVPVTWLGEQLQARGFGDYEWSLPGGAFAYTSAARP